MDKYTAIRERAADIVRQYERNRGKSAFSSDQGSHAVLSDLAFTCFGLTVMDDPGLPEGVTGQLDLNGAVISVRCSLAKGRRSFTVAHEIAHAALEHPGRCLFDGETEIDERPDFSALTVQNGVYRSYNSRERCELEANVFAAQLLAPAEIVQEKVRKNPNWTVDGLSAYFGLTQSAMLNQLVAALLPGPTAPTDTYDAKGNTFQLDPRQKGAIDVSAPALVIAGPGSGKTRVLVERFVRLVNDGTNPGRILALTFANKAAEEMRDRLSVSLPGHAHEIQVSTFHSFGLDLLKGYGNAIGIDPSAKLFTPLDAFAYIKTQLASIPMGVFEDIRSPGNNLGLLLAAVSRAKDELTSPEEFLRLAQEWQSSVHSAATSGGASADDHNQELEEATRSVDAGHFYIAYRELMRSAAALDYGDLIAESVRLLDLASTGDEIRKRYDFVLVDEFQDINYASGRLLESLDGGRGIVWAVGDPKQSIYRFRGASPANLMRFTEDYPGAEVVALDRNYRSVEDIVKCGQAVEIPARSDGRNLSVASLVSDRGRESTVPAVEVVVAADRNTELVELVRAVAQAAEKYGRKEVCVLCRTRSQAHIVSDSLELAGVPTTWCGALEERAAFRDIIGLLYLASGDLRGLVRVAGMVEHRINDTDLRMLMAWAKGNGADVHRVLHAACDGVIAGVSEDCVCRCAGLKKISGAMRAQPTAFHAVTAYLFKHSNWCRELMQQETPETRRVLSTLGQVCAMARSFRPAIDDGSSDIPAFVEYLESCVEAGELVAPLGEPSESDAVSVMTVHHSKGLEWDAVFVPFLTDGRFPNKARHETLPLPQGMIQCHDVNDDMIEEACLFYVAVTRARNYLMLMRAERYGRSAQPSPFLERVLGELRDTGYVAERDAAAVVQASSVEPAVTTTGYSFNGCPKTSALMTFADCPKRFEFQSILGLRDDDTGYLDFRSALFAAMQECADEAAHGSVPDANTAVAALERHWDTLGPTSHWYEQRFKRNAEQILLTFLGRLRPGVRVEFRQEFTLATGNQRVSVTVDEVEQGDEVVLRKHHFGKPAKSHLSSDASALLVAAGEQGYIGRTCRTELLYPAYNRQVAVDLTPKVVGNRVQKMSQLASEAETGPYVAKPNAFTCKTCYYRLICPSGSEEQM